MNLCEDVLVTILSQLSQHDLLFFSQTNKYHNHLCRRHLPLYLKKYETPVIPLNDNGNTAIGHSSLHETGNTAIGHSSLHDITIGYKNNAIGSYSLRYLTDGYCNNAIGSMSLYRLTNGFGNTAIGTESLKYNNGRHNIAIGYQSGLFNDRGDNNIYIGHIGADESDTIRIGSTHKRNFQAGIVPHSGYHVPVYITNLGQLVTDDYLNGISLNDKDCLTCHPCKQYINGRWVYGFKEPMDYNIIPLLVHEIQQLKISITS